jgi:hypothetical protein
MCNTSQGFYGTNNSLSPKAKEVLFAFMNSLHKEGDGKYVNGEWVPFFHTQIAAALRAVADKVVPEAAPPPMGWAESYACWNAQDDIRYELLAIANELENYNV